MLAQTVDASKGLKRGIYKIGKQIEALLDRVVKSGTPSVISAYEKRIGKLEAEKFLLAERMAQHNKPLRTLEESFESALQFIE